MNKGRYLIALFLIPIILACGIFQPKRESPASPTLTPSPAPTLTPTAVVTLTEEPASEESTLPGNYEVDSHIIEWITFVGNTAGGLFYVSDFAVGPDGFIYVITNDGEPEGSDCRLLKIASNGIEQWRILVASFKYGECSEIVFDQVGNIYISGIHPIAWGASDVPVGNLNGTSEFIAKFDVNGVNLQNYFFDYNLSSYDFAIDSMGNMYLATDSRNGFSLSKLNPDGVVEWEKTYPSKWDYTPSRLEIDNYGNILVNGDIGYWNVLEKTEGDCFLSVLTPDGELDWSAVLGTEDGDDICYDIAMDNGGYIYVSGSSNVSWGNPLQPYQGGWHGSARDPRLYADFVAKFSSDGSLLWNTFTENPRMDTNDLAIDAEGNLVIPSWGGISQISPDGSVFRLSDFQGDGEYPLEYLEIEMDDQQNVYVFGDVRGFLDASLHIINPPIGNENGSDSFIAKVTLEKPLEDVNDQGPYREAGPLVPKLTTFIPTPKDVNAEPLAVWWNLFLAVVAAALMLPLALVVDTFSESLRQISRLALGPFAAIWADIRKPFSISLSGPQQIVADALKEITDILKLFLVIAFYAVVFSLLDPTWEPFSVTGAILFFEMAIAFGVVGILDDIIQWFVIRAWGTPGSFKIRFTNVIVALVSVGVSRLIPILPGLMFGSPEALIVDETRLTAKQSKILTRITLFTYVGIGLMAWLPTILLDFIVQQKMITENAKTVVAGLEGFLLVVFAVALENVFVQLVGLSDGMGKKFRKENFWAWFLTWVPIAFLFLQILLNPRNGFLQDLQTGNTGIFIAVTAFFMIAALIFVGSVRLLFWALKKR